MKHSIQKLLSWMLVFCMVLGLFPAVHASGAVWEKTDQKITADPSQRPVRENRPADRDPDELVRVSIVLDKPSAVEAGYATMGIAANARAVDYRAQLLATQKRMEKTISNQVLKGRPLNVVWNMTLVGNIISAWVPYGSVEKIADLRGVKSVAMEAQYQPAVAERHEGAAPEAYPSGGMIGSGALWSSGCTGAGSRIAIIDTGTDIHHQSFDNGAYLYALEQNAAAKDMSLEDYMDSLHLLTEDAVAKVLPQLHASQRYEGLSAEELYLNEKLPFAFNYVDHDLDIVHDHDQQGEHGSHVAGIATANRYIPVHDGYADARDFVRMLGVAPDAQLLTMKVFGKGDPYDSDYMVAIEDAIMLGCDAVNLSLGTTMPGSPYNDTFSELMERMQETDTVVTISAGNAGNWSAASTFGYLYHDDVSFDTVGSPGSYTDVFTVASVENAGAVGAYFTASGKTCFYSEPAGYGNRDFMSLDRNGSGTDYEYVMLDAKGDVGDYLGLNVAGRIVFVFRSNTLSPADQFTYAIAKGAAAVVICSDESYGLDLTGIYYTNPVASIGYASARAIMEASTQVSDIAYTGTMTVYGRMGAGVNNAGDYTMSSFSSWGVPSSLTLKPEITAPGGGIHSVWGSNPVNGGGTDKYETMSGTSMAAPQVAGMAALLAQVYREQKLDEKTGISARHLAQSLLMSTAEPMREADSGGGYYSLLRQGAGLARVDLAAQAGSFVHVIGQDDYKAKAELGDDPQRTGIYTFDFTITNLEDTERAYTLDADLFRQDSFEYLPDSDVWLLDNWTTALEGGVTFSSANMIGVSNEDHDLNGDGVTDGDDADFLLEYVAGNGAELMGDGDLSGDGRLNSYDAHLLLAGLSGDTVTIPAGETAAIRVTIKLSDEAKAEMDAKTPKGTYVQAFVYARSAAEGGAGTVHSIPVLAFYGDWSEPSMYDRGTLMELVSMTSNTAPYLYQAIGPYGNALSIDYGDGKEYYYGGNPILDDDTYLPARNAFNSQDASRIVEQGFTLIRGAGAARIQIVNAETDEVYFEHELGELYPAYYSPAHGQWLNSIQYADLNWSGRDAAGEPLPEGTRVNISLTAVPYYYRQADGSYAYEDLGAGATMTTPLTIDNTAPEILDIDVSRIEEDQLTITARDNEYVAAVAVLNPAGTRIYASSSANQTEKGITTSTVLDVGDVYGTNFLIAVYDYAKNKSVYEVEIDLGEPVREYFTAYDSTIHSYVSIDRAGKVHKIAETDLPVPIRAAEYVGGYVFSITEDNSLCVASDADLTHTQRICDLDPDRQWLMTFVNDLAYNKADGKLYCQFYSNRNYEIVPYLGTIDMKTGKLHVLGEMPRDVNTMAIDGQGNFYSAGFESSTLYTYTVDRATGRIQNMTAVGNMGNYISGTLSSMAWDHNEDKLYWAYPNTLLEIDPKTAAVTVVGMHTALLAGLYTRPEENEGRFDETDEVEQVELRLNETRIMKGASYSLEASVWPWNASDRTVSWSTSDPNVADVDENGNITARELGSCIITATSNLDPTVSASCTVEVFEQAKSLQAMIGDEKGEVWMSEIEVAELPDYSKLSENSLGIDFGAATMGQDGWIYAASLNKSAMSSELYKLDPETFEPTWIGSSVDAYVDLAPAPGGRENSLMAVYGGNVLNVDATTGDYYNWYYMFSYSLVGIAYVGTQEYKYGTYDTMVDWYFIIDRMGYVYLMGFLEQDGVFRYLEHERLAPGGIYTKLDFEMETPYYGSAYFDGEMLYYSAYKESDNRVTLMAIDVAGGSKAVYELGNFDEGVRPVAGLMELGKIENHIDFIEDGWNVQTMAQPKRMEQRLAPKGSREAQEAAPVSAGEAKKELVYVDVTLPSDAANADMLVSFDDSMLELAGVSGNAPAFAWRAEDGAVRLSLADSGVISAANTVARLTFRACGTGETAVTIATEWLGDAGCNHEESIKLEVVKPHEHTPGGAVQENEVPATCTADGSYDSVVYCSGCGEQISRKTVTVPATGHSYKDGICGICKDEMTSDFRDVPAGAFYFDPVAWAVGKGITNGTDAGLFDPNGQCMRAVVVTFLWRAAGEPKADDTANPFVDVDEDDFYYDAVLWAVEQGITQGMDKTHFGPTVYCNRAQVVTFLWRAQGSPESSATVDFTDVKPGEFYSDAVAWAVEKKITNGMGGGMFGVDAICNRAQVVTFLFRTLDA